MGGVFFSKKKVCGSLLYICTSWHALILEDESHLEMQRYPIPTLLLMLCRADTVSPP